MSPVNTPFIQDGELRDDDYAELALDLNATLSNRALEVIGEWQQYGSCQPEGAARVVDELAQILHG